jgi:chemotaxis receptor (MCP) glutamine deamidase CheD
MSDALAIPAPSTETRQVYVLPGEVRSAATPTRFVTILGSCVAICLYDPVRHLGGINHFLLPGEAPPSEREPLRWGTPSIAMLYEQVVNLGANRRFLQAKVFGGAQISQRDVPGQFRIGDRNIAQAIEELARLGVELRNRRVGGNTGLKIVFESHTGTVWVKELSRDSAAKH